MLGPMQARPLMISSLSHPKWQERRLLVEVKRLRANVTREELLDHLASRVAKWWLPDDVVFIDELPHTATGRVLKTRLGEQHRGHLLPS
jgi:fatty-acyl-CoA synthase